MPDQSPPPSSRPEAVDRPIELEGATVLIIGAGGPMGRQFALEAVRHKPARLLLADDRAALNRIDDSLSDGAELIVVDIDDRPGLRAVLDEHRPDVVVHVTPPSHAVVDDRPIEWPALPVDQATWLPVDAAEAGCRHFLRVSQRRPDRRRPGRDQHPPRPRDQRRQPAGRPRERAGQRGPPAPPQPAAEGDPPSQAGPDRPRDRRARPSASTRRSPSTSDG